MAQNIKCQASEYVVVENGYYEARFIKAEQKQGKFGPIFSLSFEILNNEDYSGVNVTGVVTAVYSPGNKLCQWITALGAPVLEPDEEFDIETLYNKKVKVAIENTEVTGKDNTVRTYSNVVSVSKLVTKKPVQAAQQAKVTQEEQTSVAQEKPAPKPASKPAPVQNASTEDDDLPF